MPLAAQCLIFGISALSLVLWDEEALEQTMVMRQPLAPGYIIYLETSQQQLLFHALAIAALHGLKSLLCPGEEGLKHKEVNRYQGHQRDM